MDRIASFSHQSRLIQNMMSAESKVAKAQLQESSNLVSTTFSGISDQSSKMVNLQGYYARSERYVDEGETVSSRIQTMHDSVGSMIEIATKAKTLITGLQGADYTEAGSTAEQAKELLDNMATLLNSQLGGRYLFAGGKTDSKPVSVDSSTYAAASYPSSASTTYYSGDDSVARFQADDDLSVDYGVTANDPAIEKVMRSLNLIANMSTTTIDTNTLNEAYDLADEGADGMTVLQTKLGTAASTVDDAIDRHLDEQLTLQSQIEDISKVDLAAATSRLSQLQSLLEASTSVLTVMKSFNLNDLL